MITVNIKDGRLIFKDYANREVSISENDYLQLMGSAERRAVRVGLEEALLTPTEVFTIMEKIEDVVYHQYKYLKFYRNLIFVAIVTVKDDFSFELNNFYSYNEHEFKEAEKERTGNRVVGNL